MKIAHVVRSIIDDHYFLQEPFIRGIAHFDKLSKYIKNDVEQIVGHEVTFGSIRTALQRYSETITKKYDKIFLNYFKEIATKTEMCYIVVEESVTSLDKLQKLNHEINNQKGGIFNISYGNYESGIVTNQDNKEKVLDSLNNEKIVNEVDNLALISLTYSQKRTHTLGIIYNVSRYFAFEDIEIFSFQNTPSELSILVETKKLPKCISILNKMKSENKKDKDMFNKSIKQLKYLE
jgi:hypothetical protein